MWKLEKKNISIRQYIDVLEISENIDEKIFFIIITASSNQTFFFLYH